MDPATERLADLFDEALDLPPAQRGAFVTRVTADDNELRQQLDSLLKSHESSGAFFDEFAAEVIAPAYAAVSSREGSAVSSALTRELEEALQDRYQIVRELGGGAMSRVFLAQELRLERAVVIKVLPSDIAATMSDERFRREILLVAQLQHPHIVPLLTSDAAGRLRYYTMPFVAGESLRARLHRDGALPLKDALTIWRDVLEALTYAHTRGVVHRDIKPANILLAGRSAMVTDFGIASAIEVAASDAYETSPGVVIGTPAYMAPEQITSHAEATSDLYSAALVMYEMLDGHLPFAGDTRADIVSARLGQDPMPLARADCRPELSALVMRCLRREPSERPLSAEAVLAEIDALNTPDVPIPAGRRVTRGAIATLIFAAVVFGAFRLSRNAGNPEAGNIVATANGGALGERNQTRRPRSTTNAAADEFYLRSKDPALRRTVAGRLQSLEYLNQALAADSTFAEAHAALAWALITTAGTPPGKYLEFLRRGEQSALKALAIDSTLPEAHVVFGWTLTALGRFEQAETELMRGIRLDPLVSRGYEGLARLYMLTEQPAKQLEAARKGLEAEPYSAQAQREMALAFNTNGRCDESLTLLEPLKRLTPPARVAGVIRGLCFSKMEKWSNAIAEFRWAMDGGDARAALAFLGYALARGGDAQEARRILDDLETGRKDSHGAFGVAVVYTGFRDYDRAFLWLEKSLEEGTDRVYLWDPVFADLHRDPRFARIRALSRVQKR